MFLVALKPGAAVSPPKFSIYTQASSNAHISSDMCPAGMSNLRHSWLADREEWGKGRKNEGRGRETADIVSVHQEHRNQLAMRRLPLPVL